MSDQAVTGQPVAEGQMAIQPGFLLPAELLTKAKHADEAIFTNLAGAGYLPRIQLNAANSGLVATDVCEKNTYVLVRGKNSVVKDYGDEFSCLVLSWRPKAVEFKDSTVKMVFNPRNPEFQRIEAIANIKGEGKKRGCLVGPEYLIYLPDVDQLALFHMNNPTMRLRAADMKALIGKSATLRVEIITKGTNIWPGPVITECSTPLTLPQAGTVEQVDLYNRIKVQMEKFNNPPEEEVQEEVKEEASASADPNARPR